MRTERITPAAERAEWERVRSWAASSGSDLRPEAIEAFREAAPIVEELRQAGIPLHDLEEFANVTINYPQAEEILIRALRREHADLTIGEIARILGRTGPSAAVQTALVDALRRNCETASEDTLFLLGHAIANTSPRGQIDTLLEVVSKRAYGAGRYGPIMKLARSRDPRVAERLKSFFDEATERDLWTAIRSLRLAKAWSFSDDVAALFDSDNSSVRQEARAFVRASRSAGIDRSPRSRS